MFSTKQQPTSELYAAARAGDIINVKAILERYKNQSLKPDRGTVSAAIKSGNVVLVRYFKEEHNLTPKSGLMEAIDEAKSMIMAQYLISEYPEIRHTIDHMITWAAARTGNLDLLKWVLQIGKPFIRADEGTLYDAVRGGSLEMVKFIVDECGITDVAEAHEFASRNEKPEIAAYLQEKLGASLRPM